MRCSAGKGVYGLEGGRCGADQMEGMPVGFVTVPDDFTGSASASINTAQ